MKANELRIGNYVRHVFNCLEINEPEYRIENGADILVHENLNCMKPIPLTEEWLVKFGFIHIKKWKYYYQLSDIVYITKTYKVNLIVRMK